MRKQLQMLWQLQTLEQKRTLLKTRKEKIKSDEVRYLWQEIRLLTQSVAADKEKLLCLQKVFARQELDLKNMTNQCHSMEERLYSGEIINIKELEQWKGKCEAARRDIGIFEEELFDSLEHCDQLAAKAAQEESLILEKQREYTEKQQEITQNITLTENEISNIEKQCDDLVLKIDNTIMNKYRALNRRLILPVAKLDNGICSGCRMSVPVIQAYTNDSFNST